MNPTFGCRLWNLIFEPNDSLIATKVENIIREDISAWIRGVTVSLVEVNYVENDTSTDLRDIYKLYISVKFVIDSINQSDVVEIILNKNKV